MDQFTLKAAAVELPAQPRRLSGTHGRHAACKCVLRRPRGSTPLGGFRPGRVACSDDLRGGGPLPLDWSSEAAAKGISRFLNWYRSGLLAGFTRAKSACWLCVPGGQTRPLACSGLVAFRKVPRNFARSRSIPIDGPSASRLPAGLPCPCATWETSHQRPRLPGRAGRGGGLCPGLCPKAGRKR